MTDLLCPEGLCLSDLGTAARTPLFKEHGTAQAEPQSTARDRIQKSSISGSSISGFISHCPYWKPHRALFKVFQLAVNVCSRASSGILGQLRRWDTQCRGVHLPADALGSTSPAQLPAGTSWHLVSSLGRSGWLLYFSLCLYKNALIKKR